MSMCLECSAHNSGSGPTGLVIVKGEVLSRVDSRDNMMRWFRATSSFLGVSVKGAKSDSF